MKEILLDTLIDFIKILPFLFCAFLLMEYMEHKVSKKFQKKIISSGRFGPIIGSILGAFPQCGFSVAMTNLYAGKIITIGTLIAVYLSTSDEMIPVMLSSGAKFSFVLTVILLKIVIGMLFGLIIDLTSKKKKIDIENVCIEDECHCENGIIKSSIHHTINIGAFILITTLLLNLGIHYLGTDKLSNILLKGSIFSPFISSLIGLIPNCASSIVITELYLNSSISFGSMLAGLLTGSGIALMVLFKVNKNIKENIKILSIIYLIGSLVGLIFDLFNIL